jgi:hypothetical protein
MKTKKFITILFVLILGFGSSFGQLYLKKGFLITKDNDTIRGLIDDRGEILNSRLCVFRENKEAASIRYRPEEIKDYGIDDEKLYHSTEIVFNNDTSVVFTNVLILGKINLYHYWKNKEMLYYIEKDPGILIGLLNKREVIPVSSESLYGVMNSKNTVPLFSDKFANQLKTTVDVAYYKDTLQYLFSDNQAVTERIDKLKYNTSSIMKITLDYIRQSCQGNECVSYLKNTKKYKPSFGLFTGYQLSNIYYWQDTYTVEGKNYSYSLDVDSDIVPSFLFGAFINFPLSSIYDRLSVQTELISNTIQYNVGSIRLPDYNRIGLKSSTLSAPVMLKYQQPGKRFSPSLAIGNQNTFVVWSQVYDPENIDIEDPNGGQLKQVFHKRQAGGWFFDLGTSYRLSQKFSIFASVRCFSNKSLVVSKSHKYNSSYQLNFKDVEAYNFYEHRFKSDYLSFHLGLAF